MTLKFLNNNDSMNKIDNIRDKIITMQLSTTVAHQGVHCCLPEERFVSFAPI